MILDARGDILIDIWFKRLPECKRKKGNKRGPLQFQSANWHTVSLAISYFLKKEMQITKIYF